MRVGIDATALPSQLGGAGNYVTNLVRALPRIDQASEYVVFTQPNHSAHFDSSRVHVIQVSLGSRLLRIVWEQTVLPALVQKYRLDLLHSPHYTMPLLKPCPTVVTFHDMTFFLYPEMHQAYKRVFFRKVIHWSARRADAIIADSISSRQDILRLLNLDGARVTAVPLGVSDAFRTSLDVRETRKARQKYHLPSPFILSVGVLEPRKNLTGLLRAFKTLVDRGVEHSLVIVGKRGWGYAEIFKSVKTFGLLERVIFPGYVPEIDLPSLYSAADLFVYPSFYEGFGLPVLEAMGCGVPVVTSNLSSMPEIAGDPSASSGQTAAVLIDPHDDQALADAMQRVLTDRALHDRLAREGHARSRSFSWERTARETLAVYQRVVQPR